MTDPYSDLRKTLETVLNFESTSNDRYRFAPAQNLKDASDLYSIKKDKMSFISLIKAIGAMHPYFKIGVEFGDIKQLIAELAIEHGMPPINWDKVLLAQRNLSSFQYAGQTAQSEGLIPWINEITRQDFTTLTYSEQTRVLVEICKNQNGFTPKLKNHIVKQPDFIFSLAFKSEDNFLRIASSRLNLFLDDTQIAELMINHMDQWVKENAEPQEQLDVLFQIMSPLLDPYGRTLTRLLENKNVTQFLEDKEPFKTYYKEKPEGPVPSHTA